MFTLAEENYLKAIYHLESTSKTGISTNAIANKLDTKASSVTDMVKKLSDKELVVYKKYRGVHLTRSGKKIASNIIRKHRLWEVFLVKKLNFSWDEVHDVAEQLEHIKSQKLIDELDAFLGFPKSDPHGDPIPDKDGHITLRKKVKLSTLKPKEESILLSVKDSSDDFLRYLDKKEIAIGNTIKILAIEPFDKSMQVMVNKTELSITNEVAENLLVKEI
ncbi:MAG: metal-dependent transcriptional regulator [Flavobacteriaceae bacterium]|nr:metal-dependent transcriptional regulator [Flavobacteriaceae bacterium]